MGTPVSVVVTVFNEAASLGPLLDSLTSQVPSPDEIVITDAGSTDGTRELLDAAAADGRIKVVDAPGGRSRGRNVAVAAAAHEVVAFTDAGCVAEAGWLTALTAPFEDGAEWVAGFYRPAGRTVRSTCIGLVMVPVRAEIDPEDFAPSARSMAVTRAAWQEVGGFPESLDFAEDTEFDRRLTDAGYRAVFAGDAIVAWTPPSGLGGLGRTAFRWGRGDGLAGLRGEYYKRTLKPFLAAGVGAAVLLVVYPPAVILALAPVIPGVWHRTKHKYVHVRGASKYLWIPAADLTAAIASLAGKVAGWRERRSAAS